MKSSLQIYVEELKWRFFYSILGWAMCLLVCWTNIDPIIYAFVKPYLVAVLDHVETHHTVNADQIKHVNLEISHILESFTRHVDLPTSASLLTNLSSTEITVALSTYADRLYNRINESTSLLWTNVTEAFQISLDCCWFSSFVFSCPIFFYSIWCFLIPGLRTQQRVAFTQISLLFIGFILLCFFMCNQVVLPNLWKWFLSFETNQQPLQSIYKAKMAESIRFINLFYWWTCLFGASIPVFIHVMLVKGWLLPNLLVDARRIIFFVCLVASSLISPPDFLAQILVTIAFMVLYEILVVLSFVYKRALKGSCRPSVPF